MPVLFTENLQGGPKTGLFLRIDNFATISDKKACDVKSLQILTRKMYKTRLSLKLNILFIVCINIQCICNYA